MGPWMGVQGLEGKKGNLPGKERGPRGEVGEGEARTLSFQPRARWPLSPLAALQLPLPPSLSSLLVGSPLEVVQICTPEIQPSWNGQNSFTPNGASEAP